MTDPTTRAEEGANAAWDRAADFVRLRASLDAAESRAASAEAEVEKLEAALQRERQRGRTADHLQVPILQRAEAAEASASALRDRVAVLEKALKPFAEINVWPLPQEELTENALFTIFKDPPGLPDFTGADLAAARAALNGGDHV